MQADAAATSPPTAAAASDDLRLLWIWLFAAGAFLLVAAPLLDPELQLYYRDTARLYYPVKLEIAARLRRGELALWDPWTQAGVSILGQLSPGVFHPLTLLYLALPFDLAFKLNHLLALPLGGAGAFLLARALGSSRAAALAGAVAYGGCGYLVSVASSNLPYAVGAATVPLALAALLWLHRAPGPGRLLAASAALASCAWAGEPQSMLFAGLLGTGWAAAPLLLAGAGEPEPAIPRWRESARRLGRLAACSACAVALAAPSLVPVLPQLAAGKRLHGLSAEERENFANHPARLVGLLVPRAFDDTSDQDEALAGRPSPFGYFKVGVNASFADSISLGAPALLLAAAALWAGRRGRLLLLGAGLLALASTGDALGLQQLGIRLVPGFGLFRYAEKLIAPCSLLVAVAAALGADQAFGAGGRRLRGFAALCGAAAAALAAARVAIARAGTPLSAWLVGLDASHHPARPAAFLDELGIGLVYAAGMAALLALLALLALRRRRLALLLLSVACLATALTWCSRLLFVAPAELLRDPPPLARQLLDRAGPSAGRWRLLVSNRFHTGLPSPQGTDYHLAGTAAPVHALLPQTAALFHIEAADRYFSLEDAGYGELIEAAPVQALALLGVRFVVAMPAELSPRLGSQLGFSRTGEGYWVRENPPVPRAFLARSVRKAAGGAELSAALGADGFDPFAQVLLLPPWPAAAEGPAGAAPPGGKAVAWRRPKPEAIDLEVDAPAPAIAVFSEHFDPGWHATVDGAEAEVVAADALVLGVPVAPGRHRISLRFRPRGLTAALLLAGACAAALALAQARRRG